MLIEHLSLFCFAFFNFMGIKTPFGLILVYFPPFFFLSPFIYSVTITAPYYIGVMNELFLPEM